MSGFARTSPMVLDSGTSTAAAALQTVQRRMHVRAVITSLLAEHGALTDDEILPLYQQRAAESPTVPRVTPQSIRTRRHELVRAGLVREAGIGTSALGNRASKWSLA